MPSSRPENSLLMSLNELRNIEKQRVDDERAAEARARQADRLDRDAARGCGGDMGGAEGLGDVAKAAGGGGAGGVAGEMNHEVHQDTKTNKK